LSLHSLSWTDYEHLHVHLHLLLRLDLVSSFFALNWLWLHASLGNPLRCSLENAPGHWSLTWVRKLLGLRYFSGPSILRLAAEKPGGPSRIVLHWRHSWGLYGWEIAEEYQPFSWRVPCVYWVCVDGLQARKVTSEGRQWWTTSFMFHTTGSWNAITRLGIWVLNQTLMKLFVAFPSSLFSCYVFSHQRWKIASISIRALK
jgi:hypothetical protein